MATTSPYKTSDCFVLNYDDGEYSLERYDKSGSLTASDVTHTVLEGETLQGIAHTYYGDSGRWGDIATMNDIVDPFDLSAGTNLIIPV